MIENTLWTEKYRPQNVDDCILQDDIKNVAKGIVSSGEMPNLLLGGQAGTGKTTLAVALCKMFGYEYMIINGSNDRNIDTLRTTVTQFASSMSMTSDMKVVILDEADYLSPLFQAALRNFTEEFSKTTRFVLTCNYPGKIIEPLHSRCAVLDFTIKAKDKPKMAADFMKRVCYILDSEGVAYDKQAVGQVILKFFPDFRRVINELQRYAAISGKVDSGVVGALDSLELSDLVKALKAKDFKAAKRWVVENLATVDQHVIYRKLYDSLYDMLEPSSIPAAILLIANYQHRGTNCVDPEINASALMIELMAEMEFK